MYHVLLRYSPFKHRFVGKQTIFREPAFLGQNSCGWIGRAFSVLMDGNSIVAIQISADDSPNSWCLRKARSRVSIMRLYTYIKAVGSRLCSMQ